MGMGRFVTDWPPRSAALAMLALLTLTPGLARSNPGSPPPSATLPQPAGPRLARDYTGRDIELRPLDDPANPYSGQYSAYDRWVWEHLVFAPTPSELKYFLNSSGLEAEAFRAGYPAGWSLERAQVSAEGWLRPSKLGNSPFPEPGRSLRDFVAQGRSAYSHSANPSVYAAGVLPAAMEAVRETDKLYWLASLAPPIPAWLGEHPPLSSILLPNGEVIALGPLDLHLEGNPGWNPWERNFYLEGGQWRRYSPEGRLLGSRSSMDFNSAGWRELYGLTLEAEFAALNASQSRSMHFAGRFLVLAGHNADTPEALAGGDAFMAAFDYDGRRVSLDLILTAEDLSACQPIPQQSLAQYYAAQLAVGKTSGDSQSPYWGRSEGPVFTNPAPRQPRRFAQAFGQGAAKFVELIPLDSLQNPRRADYAALDRWVYEHCGVGYRLPQPDYQADGTDNYAYGLPAYFAELTALASPDGVLFPLAQRDAWLEQLGLFTSPSTADWKPLDLPQAWASGEMDASLWDEYCCGLWQHGVARLPAVPAWLSRQRFIWAVFAPEGSILVLPLVDSVTGGQRARILNTEWIRYSQDGTELERRAIDNPGDWGLFFDPDLVDREEAARLQGYSAYMHQGYLKVFPKDAPSSQTPLAAYDYLGHPLDPAALQPYPPGIGCLLQSRDIVLIYRLQHYLQSKAAAGAA